MTKEEGRGLYNHYTMNGMWVSDPEMGMERTWCVRCCVRPPSAVRQWPLLGWDWRGPLYEYLSVQLGAGAEDQGREGPRVGFKLSLPLLPANTSEWESLPWHCACFSLNLNSQSRDAGLIVAPRHDTSNEMAQQKG